MKGSFRDLPNAAILGYYCRIGEHEKCERTWLGVPVGKSYLATMICYCDCAHGDNERLRP